MEQISKIKTEQRNAHTVDIDRVSTSELVRIMNEEDKKVALAVEQVLPQIAEAIDVIYRQMCRGGRLIYCGCGTSGRLGALDAAECPPTFSGNPDLLKGVKDEVTARLLKAKETLTINSDEEAVYQDFEVQIGRAHV